MVPEQFQLFRQQPFSKVIEAPVLPSMISKISFGGRTLPPDTFWGNYGCFQRKLTFEILQTFFPSHNVFFYNKITIGFRLFKTILKFTFVYLVFLIDHMTFARPFRLVILSLVACKLIL